MFPPKYTFGYIKKYEFCSNKNRKSRKSIKEKKEKKMQFLNTFYEIISLSSFEGTTEKTPNDSLK